MSPSFFSRKRQVWVFVVLLVYSIQSFASVAGVAMMHDESQAVSRSGCHSDDMSRGSGVHMEELPGQNVSPHVIGKLFKTDFMDCCDEDCDMAACHAGGAIPEQISDLAFARARNESFRYTNAPPSAIVESQYRPPILG